MEFEEGWITDLLSENTLLIVAPRQSPRYPSGGAKSSRFAVAAPVEAEGPIKLLKKSYGGKEQEQARTDWAFLPDDRKKANHVPCPL
jgi:hypothetical protein